MDEFCFYIKSKMIDVNALHTMVCALAYVEGSKQNFALDCIPNMHFSSLLDKTATQKFMIELHSQLYDIHLRPTEMQFGEHKAVHSKLSYNFIEYLFLSPKETVGRGLDYRTDSAISKFNQHSSLLKSAKNTYVDEILDTFCLLIK